MSARIEYDLLLVGGSPSNLTLAYHLLELAKVSGKELTVAILEKGKDFGSHDMSGAVSKPFYELARLVTQHLVEQEGRVHALV